MPASGARVSRLALIKGIHAELIMTFSDYKKFQVDSRVVSP